VNRLDEAGLIELFDERADLLGELGPDGLAGAFLEVPQDLGDRRRRRFQKL
jgi:hypothetical protein